MKPDGIASSCRCRVAHHANKLCHRKHSDRTRLEQTIGTHRVPFAVVFALPVLTRSCRSGSIGIRAVHPSAENHPQADLDIDRLQRVCRTSWAGNQGRQRQRLDGDAAEDNADGQYCLCSSFKVSTKHALVFVFQQHAHPRVAKSATPATQPTTMPAIWPTSSFFASPAAGAGGCGGGGGRSGADGATLGSTAACVCTCKCV